MDNRPDLFSRDVDFRVVIVGIRRFLEFSAKWVIP